MTEPKTIGYALLVDLGYEDAPLEDGVYCFGTQEEAEKFAIDSLVAAGEYTRTEYGVYDNKELGKSYSDDYDALEAFQDGLSFSDYYHIREVKTLPETK